MVMEKLPMKLIKRKDIKSFKGSGKYVIGYTDGIRTVIGDNGLQGVKGARVRLYLHCLECEKDPEMYEEGIFEVNRSSLPTFRGCGCTTTHFSEEQNTIRVKRVCEEEGYTFHGWFGEYSGTSTYLDLECPEGHRYHTTRFTKFMVSGRRCGTCACNVPWDYNRFIKEAEDVHGNKFDYSLISQVKSSSHKLQIICRDHGPFPSDCHHHIQRKQECPDPACCWKKISEAKASNTKDFVAKAKLVHGSSYDYTDTVYHRSFNDVTIYCNKCEEPFIQVATDHLQGCGCQGCSGLNQRQNYIFLISGNGVPIAVKGGIAQVYTTRLKRQSDKTPYDVNVLGVWEQKNYDSCKKAERFCLREYDRNYLSKEGYPDGYSETYPLSCIDNLIKVYEDFGGVRIV